MAISRLIPAARRRSASLPAGHPAGKAAGLRLTTGTGKPTRAAARTTTKTTSGSATSPAGAPALPPRPGTPARRSRPGGRTRPRSRLAAGRAEGGEARAGPRRRPRIPQRPRHRRRARPDPGRAGRQRHTFPRRLLVRPGFLRPGFLRQGFLRRGLLKRGLLKDEGHAALARNSGSPIRGMTAAPGLRTAMRASRRTVLPARTRGPIRGSASKPTQASDSVIASSLCPRGGRSGHVIPTGVCQVRVSEDLRPTRARTALGRPALGRTAARAKATRMRRASAGRTHSRAARIRATNVRMIRAGAARAVPTGATAQTRVRRAGAQTRMTRARTACDGTACNKTPGDLTPAHGGPTWTLGPTPSRAGGAGSVRSGRPVSGVPTWTVPISLPAIPAREAEVRAPSRSPTQAGGRVPIRRVGAVPVALGMSAWAVRPGRTSPASPQPKRRPLSLTGASGSWRRLRRVAGARARTGRLTLTLTLTLMWLLTARFRRVGGALLRGRRRTRCRVSLTGASGSSRRPSHAIRASVRTGQRTPILAPTHV